MVSIAKALGRIKDDLPRLIDGHRIATHCRQLSHRWRDGVLNPAATVQLFILQILHCNTAINHLRHLTKISFTASAFCQARARLPLALLERLMSTISDALIDETRDVGRWFGHRVWHIDGSTFSMPDEPALQSRFGTPSPCMRICGPAMCWWATADIAHTFIWPLFYGQTSMRCFAYISARSFRLSAADAVPGNTPSLSAPQSPVRNGSNPWARTIKGFVGLSQQVNRNGAIKSY